MRRYGENSSPFGFEDLELYQAARQFRNEIYGLTGALPPDERFGLVQQLRRAAVSITSNIAEGYGRHNEQEATQFCRHARGSLMEIIDQLGTCCDQRFIAPERLEQLRQLAQPVLRLLNGYIAFLQRRKHQGGAGSPATGS